MIAGGAIVIEALNGKREFFPVMALGDQMC